MHALKLVTFDVTGTLLKLQPIPAVVYSLKAKDFGINVSPDAVLSHFKTEYKQLSSQHPNFGCHTRLGWRNWWKMLVKNSINKAAATASLQDNMLDELAETLVEEYKTAKWWQLTDGAEEILISLNCAGVPIGVISNYDPRLDTVLEAVGIRQYFKSVTTSYVMGAMKPDIKIFNFAKAGLSNDLDPLHCLHVGNDFELDFKGATNAGWSAALINSKYHKTSHNLSGQVFGSLHDLQRRLEQNNFKTL